MRKSVIYGLFHTIIRYKKKSRSGNAFCTSENRGWAKKNYCRDGTSKTGSPSRAPRLAKLGVHRWRFPSNLALAVVTVQFFWIFFPSLYELWMGHKNVWKNPFVAETEILLVNVFTDSFTNISTKKQSFNSKFTPSHCLYYDFHGYHFVEHWKLMGIISRPWK